MFEGATQATQYFIQYVTAALKLISSQWESLREMREMTDKLTEGTTLVAVRGIKTSILQLAGKVESSENHIVFELESKAPEGQKATDKVGEE
jgi:hypothetical protein